ncbi:kinesin-like protein KIF25 isoform X3 [Piliocolobus tephrosceles]|uniref:kinesin-like protein KIF25 isoform X3 n=1 Tax=Piliocolobus tephrosceles TaxID=591936 RepID=UPI000E6B49E0|nr:kinesin-like protein KIF25 isoform X3 [Piliocolobus tephrosceles]
MRVGEPSRPILKPHGSGPVLLAASSPQALGSRPALQFSVNTFPLRRSFARRIQRFSDLIAPRSAAAFAPVTFGLGPGLSSPEAPQAARDPELTRGHRRPHNAAPLQDVLPPPTWPGPSGPALGMPPRRLLWLRAPRAPGSPGVVPALFPATYKGKIEKSRSEATRISTLYNKQQRLQRNTRSALSQLDRVIQKLNQDVQAFHSSSRALLRDYQDEYQDRVSEIVTVVQRTQQSAETLLACQAKVVHLEQALQDVSARHQLERQRRKVLHNSLVELKGNIRVHCRIRPLLPFDSESDDPVLQSSSISREVAHAVDDETVLVKCDRPGHPLINKTYHFERVYGPAESQSAVFGDVCPLLTSLLDGYNVCVMAYGQTGSGKSYTMLGPHSDDGPVLPLDPQSDLGIIPRATEELFRLISENPSRSPKVEVSIVEVYNNDIFDLLAKDTVAAVSGVKREVMTAKDGRTEVALLASEAVNSASKLMELVRGGLQLRAKHPTLVHADSSRSHLIITVTLTTAACSDSTADQACSATLPREQTEAGRAGRSRRTSQGASALQPVPGDPAGRAEHVQARLQLVDLAGSECIGVSGVTGSALRETACINRSLAALADVLGALSEHRGHVPYRNSKLTHLLQDCLARGTWRRHCRAWVSGSELGKSSEALPERGRPAPRRRGRGGQIERINEFFS